MKQFRKIAIVALLIVAMSSFIALFTACDKVTDVKLKSDSMPQTVFVLGQDLKLAGGKLTVTNNGEEEEIALDAPGVTVTGYDKDKLGKQELTVEYKDIVTTYEVTVVERIVAKNYTDKYFVGEEFNNVSGSLTVTDDNGMSVNVPMKDDAVKTTFDSSVAGTVNVSVSYNNYTGTFPVQVLDVATTELNKPPVRDYFSHEQAISLSGCSIVLKSAGTGTNVLTRRIVVTEDMISEYDLSAATIANIDTPLVQNIKVTYAGQVVGNFDINIKYSGVSLMQDCAKQFASIDFSTEPTISEPDGELAITALTNYFSMADVYKDLVSAADKATVVRVASVYGKKAWLAEAETYKDTFVIKATREKEYDYDENDELIEYEVVNFSFEFTSTDYETAKADFARLDDSLSDLVRYCSVLNDIQKSFADVTVVGEDKVSEYLDEVYSKEVYNQTLKKFDFMFELYDMVKGLPNDTTDETVKNYSQVILDSIKFIDVSELYDEDIYASVSAWRGGNDLIDTYLKFCYLTQDATNYNIVANVSIPDEFYNLFLSIYIATMQMQNMEFSYEGLLYGTLEYDTTMFMWYYTHILETAEKLKNSDDDMTAWVYENLELVKDVKFDDFILSLEEGYDSVLAPVYDIKECLNIWDKYLAIVDDYMINQVYNTEMIGDLIDSLLALPDTYIYGFLTTVNSMYSYLGMPNYSMDVSTEYSYTVFTDMLQVYAKGLKDEEGKVVTSASIPESTVALFDSLLKSIEDACRRSTNPLMSAMESPYTANFLKNMKEAVALYEALAADQTKAEDLAAFNAKFGAVYQRYLAIYNLYNDEGKLKDNYADLGDWEPVFDLINEMTFDARYEYYLMTMGSAYGVTSDAYSVIVAKYELANKLAQSILNSGNEYIIEAYKNKVYSSEIFADTTLEYSLFLTREAYAYILVVFGYWDDYQQAEVLKDYMADAAMVIELGYKEELEDGDMQYVATSLANFRQLDVEDQWLFSLIMSISPQTDYYYGALYNYLLRSAYYVDGAANMNCAQFTNNLFLLETSTMLFRLIDEPDQDDIEAFTLIYQRVTTSYQALTEEEKQLIPDCISEMYNYYCEKYAELMN